MRYILQVIGASFLLVGSILFFFPSPLEKNQRLTERINNLEAENRVLQQKITQLEERAGNSETAIKTTITIQEGSNSTTVAKSLENAKIIDDAESFNNYLVNTGLANNIRVGEYEVHKHMTFKQLAETITQKN